MTPPGPLALASPLLLALALVLPPAATPDQGSLASGTDPTEPAAAAVVVVSVDGLTPAALRELRRKRAPSLFRLVDEGAGTRNARTARERTTTLPNHTSMVTGLRIDASAGGHGVTWNDERLEPGTVQEAAGRPVGSMFEVVHEAAGSTALFASKQKLRLYERSWPDAFDGVVVRRSNRRLVRRVRHDLTTHGRALTFVHLSRPDVVGHKQGFMSTAYLEAVEDVDTLVGRLLATLESDPALRGRSTLLLTSDHGGSGSGHADATLRSSYRVPFFAWGAGVEPGANLYELNPDYADPRRRRPGYDAERPPVRNGDVANLVTDLLGLGPVPGAEINATQGLDLR